MKELKKMDKVVSGVWLGYYEFIPETIIDNAKKFGYGKTFKWATMRCDQAEIPEHLYSEWAQYFKDTEIYFNIDSTQVADKLVETGAKSMLTPEICKRIDEIAGEYFIGADMSEFGSFYSSKFRGYRRYYSKEIMENLPHGINPIQGFKTIQEARDTFVAMLKKHVDINKELDIRTISNEAVTLLEYCFEAGADIGIIEICPRNTEQILNFGRGAIRAYEKGQFGIWLAHECYSGNRTEDPLKARRFTLEYLFCYLAGASFIELESGYRGLHFHGVDYDENHPLAKAYLKEAVNFAEFCEKDERPAKGPITKVAFVKGNLDGFGWGNSSSLWGQYDVEEWGFSAPEHSYRILDYVYKKLDWCDAKNFGDHDYSGSPGYGQYDVVPISAPLHILKEYDWLIFTGWNTMTEEIFDKLKEFVAQGGNVLIGACHLRDSIVRGEKGNFVKREDYEEFFGCEVTDDIIRSNDGFKFDVDSNIEGLLYPGSRGMECDPAWTAGYADYVKIIPKGATPVCMLADNYRYDPEYMTPMLTEHKFGKGNVMLMANAEYPGAPEIFPIYKIIVKTILAATHRAAAIKVVGSDTVRFAVYETDDKYKLYLLNMDYDVECTAKVIYKDKEVKVTIPSVAVETLEFDK